MTAQETRLQGVYRVADRIIGDPSDLPRADDSALLLEPWLVSELEAAVLAVRRDRALGPLQCGICCGFEPSAAIACDEDGLERAVCVRCADPERVVESIELKLVELASAEWVPVEARAPVERSLRELASLVWFPVPPPEDQRA